MMIRPIDMMIRPLHHPIETALRPVRKAPMRESIGNTNRSSLRPTESRYAEVLLPADEEESLRLDNASRASESNPDQAITASPQIGSWNFTRLPDDSRARLEQGAPLI